MEKTGSGKSPKPRLYTIFNTWDYKEFVTGWGSAFINITITFPINKVIFRQMIHDVTLSKAFNQLRSEGFFILYRGILPPLCQKTTSLSLMFGIYEGAKRPLDKHMPPFFAQVAAGMIAGTTEAVLTPFERIQTLLQDRKYQEQLKNTRHAFKKLGAEFGIAEAYRGLVPILLRNGPSNVLYFAMRDAIPPTPYSWLSEGAKDFICGGLIGGVLSTVFFPLNVIKLHMQKSLGGEFIGILTACSQIYNERGRTISGFYTGVHLNYTRGFITWGILTVSSKFIQKSLS